MICNSRIKHLRQGERRTIASSCITARSVLFFRRGLRDLDFRCSKRRLWVVRWCAVTSRSFREIAGNFAHYCPTDDSAAWAEAVLEAAGATNDRLRSSGRRKDNALRFRWDRCAAEMLDVYREAANA